MRTENQLVAMPPAGTPTGWLQRKCACGQHTTAGGECTTCERNRINLQRISNEADRPGHRNEVPQIVHEVISSSGQPLDGETRAFFEPRFGHDFSRVRVHTDAKAEESARAVNALAYTVGHDVVFRAGRYDTGTSEGRKLIAHELTHVVQQSGSRSGVATISGISQPCEASEIEADQMAARIVEGGPVPAEANAGGSVQPTSGNRVSAHSGQALVSKAPVRLDRTAMPWPFNGYVINNSSEMVTVWSDGGGVYTIAAGATSNRYSEDVDHIRDRSGQWYKIGPNTVTVDAAGQVHGYQCKVAGYGLDCPTTSLEKPHQEAAPAVTTAVPRLVKPRDLSKKVQRSAAGDGSSYGRHWGNDFSLLSTVRRTARVIQTKLAISQPGDKYEQDADRVAQLVMTSAKPSRVSHVPAHVQPSVTQPTEQIDSGLGDVDRVLAGAGRPLEPPVRRDMEHSFGSDFSRVRVHTGPLAEQSTRALKANAYTVGENIVFAAGRFAPGTSEGRRLLAHELTHVVQQSGREGSIREQSNAHDRPASLSSLARSIQTNGGGVLQRDLALEPTNLNPQAVNLTDAQIRDAIRFNRSRYDAENTRRIQDMVGVPQTGVFDEETIRVIARYQDDFNLPADGKVGSDTFRQLMAEMQAENVGDQRCLTMYEVEGPDLPLQIHPAGLGMADISSRFRVRARFSPHCNCSQFDYRQFICGTVTRTQAGVVTNINNLFNIPGGGLPACPGSVEDGNTTQAQNGRYGHRSAGATRINNRYLDDTGAVDMTNGCRFESFDVPGMFGVPANHGDRYDFDIRFFGDIRRNGVRTQRKFWAVRDNITIP